ncbi:MAG TPA: hypothetical protein VGI80_08650, partial [Pyrinomonadaceae bacterium]
IDFDADKDVLTFSKQAGKMIISEGLSDDRTPDEPLVSADAIGLPLPTTSAAPQMSKSKGEDPRES